IGAAGRASGTGKPLRSFGCPPGCPLPGEPLHGEINSPPLREESGVGGADAADPNEARLLESGSNLFKWRDIKIDVSIDFPDSPPIFDDRGALFDLGRAWSTVLGKVKRSVPVVADAEQEHPAVEFVDPGEGRPLAKGKVDGVIGDDPVRVRAPGGEGERRMGAPARTGPASEKLGDRPHSTRRGVARVEGGHLLV